MKKVVFIVFLTSLYGCDRNESAGDDNISAVSECSSSPTRHYAKSFQNIEAGSSENLYLRSGEEFLINDSKLFYSSIYAEEGSTIKLGSVETESIVLHVEQSCTFYGEIDLGIYNGSIHIECMEDMVIANINSSGSISLYSDGNVSTTSTGLINTNGGDLAIVGRGESIALEGEIQSSATLTVGNGDREWSWGIVELSTAGVLTSDGSSLMVTDGELQAVGYGGVIRVDASLNSILEGGSVENSDGGLTSCSI